MLRTIIGVGAKTACVEKASPWENGYVGSFNGKLRDEVLNGEVFNTLREAQVLIEEWRRHDNRVRPHSALGYRPTAPETAPAARSQISSGTGATAMAHQDSSRTTRWGLVTRADRWRLRQGAVSIVVVDRCGPGGRSARAAGAECAYCHAPRRCGDGAADQARTRC